MKAVEFIQHGHIKRSRRRPFFAVAVHVEVVVVGALVGKTVNQRGIAVERENHRFISRKDGVEFAIRQSVRMFGRSLQRHKIDHVDHADLNVGESVAEQRDRGKGLKRRNVSGASHDHIRFRALVGRSPVPDAQPR